MQAAGVPLMTPLTSSFADVPVSSWMARYTERAKYLDIVHGQMIDGQLLFRPDDGITRAESAKVIMRTLFPGWL